MITMYYIIIIYFIFIMVAIIIIIIIVIIIIIIYLFIISITATFTTMLLASFPTFLPSPRCPPSATPNFPLSTVLCCKTLPSTQYLCELCIAS